MQSCSMGFSTGPYSDDTRAWHKEREREGERGREGEPPAHRARGGHSGIMTGRLVSHTCLPSNMEISALTLDCCMTKLRVQHFILFPNGL
ncbi:Hypothetical predicted protein [Xyrichtys novacula]|uniref:Uncharacterized protein n=1 Tax=Xyrichtys novacula TaxID=13765 RepID=A0AAV1GTW9_XYRNO|nr:Hypothetical predicted protein [Xyrichtys novacula]